MHPLIDAFKQIPFDPANPWMLLALFCASSALMIWRLEVVETKGFEGTVLGTLIMPYCSGFANLSFALLMSRNAQSGGLVVENALMNNVTNLTLIIGLASALGTAATPRKNNHHQRIAKLNLLFTLIAMFLFTGSLWALAKDKQLDFYDGLVLVALFLFWQILHVFEILKNNIRENRSFQWSVLVDLLLIGASAYGVYYAVNHLVGWISSADNTFFNVRYLGWLSGALMVLPNALIAFYYARINRQDIVLSSQIGDGHICIPMCIGLFALFHPIDMPAAFQSSALVIAGAGGLLALCVVAFGRVPRLVGVALLGGYGYFLYNGLIH